MKKEERRIVTEGKMIGEEKRESKHGRRNEDREDEKAKRDSEKERKMKVR